MVHTLMDGDDISQSELSVPVLDTLIALGEQRVYRDLRSSTQDTALSVAVTGNVATLPTDFLELKSVYSVGNFPAKFEPYEVIQGYIQRRSSAATGCVYYAMEGDTMIFWPILGAATVSGRYYKRFADLNTGVNALLARHWDVFAYAALAESAPILGESERLPVWEGKYTSLVQSANEYERRRNTRGSKLSIRVA